MREKGPETFTIKQVYKFTASSYENQLEIEEYYIQTEDTVNNGLNSKYYKKNLPNNITTV